MPELLSIEDFAQSIKAKYPQYGTIPDAELAGKILAKYPQYKSKIKPAGREAASTSEFEKNRPAFEKPENASRLTAPLDFAIGAEKAVGLDPMHPISSAPGAITGALGSMMDLLGLNGPVRQGLTGANAVQAPIATLRRGAQAINEQNFPEAAQAVGELYGVTKPAIEGGIEASERFPNLAREVVGREELMQRAADLKAKSNVHLPFGTPFRIRLGKMAVDATRKPRAAFYETQAVKGLPVGDGASATLREEDLHGNPPIGIRKTQPKTAAADESARINAIPPLPREIPSEPMNPVRPRVAPEVAEHFNLGKEAQGSPLEEEVKPPEAHDPTKEIPGPELGEPGATQPNWKSIEDALAPSGNKAKRASQTMDAQGQPTPFGRKLVEIVPEIKGATKASAPEALMTGYNRVVQNLNEVEDAIPEGTTVDTIPITSALFELGNEYVERGLPEVGNAIDKLREQWTGDATPWGEFLARKRAFFQNHNLRSAPMRRAYGILMEASSRVSPELGLANDAYSTVRRAIDNANVDVNTGRRISEVGKAPSKSSSVPMAERAAPAKTAIKKEPVKNRQEGLDLFKQ